MSTDLYVDVFEPRHTPVHDGGMADIPQILTRMLEVVPGGQSGVAKRLGKKVSQPQVSRWLKGAEPKGKNFERILALADELGVLDDDMRSEDVAASIDRPKKRILKVKGYVGAGGQAHYYAVAQGDLGEITASDRDPPNAAAVEIMGSSLGALFDRWYAIYDDVRRPITEDLIGEVCVVGLDDDRVLIKKVVRNGKRFDLLSNSPDEPPIKNVKIEWAAIVTDVRPK